MALRRRRSHYWGAQEFVDELAYRPGAFTLAEKRVEFAEMLAPMAEQRQADAQRLVMLRQMGLDEPRSKPS